MLFPQTVLALWGSQCWLEPVGLIPGFKVFADLPADPRLELLQTVLALWGSQLFFRPVKGDSPIPVLAGIPAGIPARKP